MSSQTGTRKLTLADIADVRAYERERDVFRAEVMETKRRRRLSFGTIITMMFENRDTMRLQIQEMARVEKLATDDEIQVELDTYNPMIPDPGQLTATDQGSAQRQPDHSREGHPLTGNLAAAPDSYLTHLFYSLSEFLMFN